MHYSSKNTRASHKGNNNAETPSHKDNASNATFSHIKNATRSHNGTNETPSHSSTKNDRYNTTHSRRLYNAAIATSSCKSNNGFRVYSR